LPPLSGRPSNPNPRAKRIRLATSSDARLHPHLFNEQGEQEGEEEEEKEEDEEAVINDTK
jgi:hypothetical protein